MSRKPVVWHNETWNFTFIIYAFVPLKEFKKHCRRKFRAPEDAFDRLENRKGVMLIQSRVCRAIIWVRKKNDYATLAHECIHAANCALDIAGVQADWKNDEAQTYLVDALMRKALARG